MSRSGSMRSHIIVKPRRSLIMIVILRRLPPIFIPSGVSRISLTMSSERYRPKVSFSSRFLSSSCSFRDRILSMAFTASRMRFSSVMSLRTRMIPISFPFSLR